MSNRSVKEVHSSCRSICYLSEPQSSIVHISSPGPTWDIDSLNINWSGLTAYAYPPTAFIHRVIRKIRQSSCLINHSNSPRLARDAPVFGTYWSSQQRSHSSYHCQQLFSNSPTPKYFTTIHVTVTGKHGSNYRLSLSCNRKSKKLNLTNLFNSQQ